jgi:hypothetical protein
MQGRAIHRVIALKTRLDFDVKTPRKTPDHRGNRAQSPTGNTEPREPATNNPTSGRTESERPIKTGSEPDLTRSVIPHQNQHQQERTEVVVLAGGATSRRGAADGEVQEELGRDDRA